MGVGAGHAREIKFLSLKTGRSRVDQLLTKPSHLETLWPQPLPAHHTLLFDSQGNAAGFYPPSARFFYLQIPPIPPFPRKGGRRKAAPAFR